MAYVTPTHTTFKVRYPEFVPVSDALVDLVLAESISQVGESWFEQDRARAQMLLTAHTLTIEGEPARSQGAGGSAGVGSIKRDKVGDVETEFNSLASEVSTYGIYAASTYGREYFMIMRKNFPAVMVV